MLFLLSWLLLTMLFGLGVTLLARWLGSTLLVGAYSGALVIAIVIAGKLGSIPGFPNLALSASVFVYSATFIFTDVLAEIWGVKEARKVVFVGAALYPILFFTMQFAVNWEPHPVWAENQAAFENTMGTTIRITIASLVSFIVSQFHDVWSFHYWKKKTKGKHLWLRNNLSTISSQFINTVIFYVIGFYGVFPIVELVLFTYFIKIIIAFIDTPFVYLAVWYLRKHLPKGQEVFN
jgi:uncharacterized integral membrane protein (TIGR00697 family)